MENNLANKTETVFESIKHTDEDGVEFWYARELQDVLEYKEWRKFEGAIEKAKQACQNSEVNVNDHFVGSDKTIKMPKGAEKTIDDFKLTRYACYLIAQNGDSRKKAIATAQTYFAVQTRKEDDACITHHKVGQAVRQTIKRIGGTMPEDLPTPSKSAKQIENEKQKQLFSKERKVKPVG